MNALYGNFALGERVKIVILGLLHLFFNLLSHIRHSGFKGLLMPAYTISNSKVNL